MSILLVLVLLKHCYIYKTEVVIKMCFAKELFLVFVLNHEKFLVVLAYCLRNLFEVVLHNSNVNEVIRAVSNLFIFFTERFYRHENQKDATKSTKSIKSTKTQPGKSTKSTKNTKIQPGKSTKSIKSTKTQISK